ncbi:MAG: hypothetical protein AAF125_08355 [Chloroflexota bacterium]
MTNVRQSNQSSPKMGQRFGAAILHIIATFAPFAAVFYFFIPLQAYTHWAFRSYYVLVWLFPLTALLQLVWGTDDWGSRRRVTTYFSIAASVIVAVLTAAWITGWPGGF